MRAANDPKEPLNPVSRKEKQVPRDRVKVLKLERSTTSPTEDILPRWLAPGEYRPNAFSTNRVEGWLHSLGPEGNLPEAEQRQHEPTCQDTPPLPGEANESASLAEPLREGLRWTLSRRAGAGPGGVFVRACRGLELEQEAAYMGLGHTDYRALGMGQQYGTLPKLGV
ncbi:hypothetical protein Esti_006296 [Eimeria stiedai]